MPNKIKKNHQAVIGNITIASTTESGGEKQRPRFESLANAGSPMNLGFDAPIVIDMQGVRLRPNIPALLEHWSSDVVGYVSESKITSEGIVLSGFLTGEDEKTNKIITHAKNGFPWSASIGFSVDSEPEKISDGEDIQVNGVIHAGPIYIAREITVSEVSFVSMGADENAFVNVAKLGVNNMTFAEWLEKMGYDANTLTSSQRKKLKASWRLAMKAAKEDDDEETESEEEEDEEASEDGDGDNEDEEDDDEEAENEDEDEDEDEDEEANGSKDKSASVIGLRKAQVVERQRIQAIDKVCKNHPGIAIKAIKAGWSKDKTELAVMRTSRPQAPAIHSANSLLASNDVIEAALCMANRLPSVNTIFDAKVLEAANKHFRQGIGIQELLIEACNRRGSIMRRITAGNLREALRAAFTPEHRAAFSTIDVAGILSNVANKFAIESFNCVEQTWRAISARASVVDFKQTSSYRLNDDLEYTEIAPTGEIEHGTLSEDVFNNRAKTYGKMMQLTRTDIINDDLGSFMKIPSQLGRGAALKLNSAFWAEFMNNASFFTTARLNYAEGAATNLSINGLTQAEQMFLDQVDAGGKPLGIMPTILLVPNSLHVVGSQIMNSTEVRDPSAATQVPTSNPHAGKFAVERSSYLSNPTITGNSTTAWYLLAGPSVLPAIETVFLNGVETPTVETAEADFNTLGIQMRGYFDFGVAKQDWRGGVKMKGVA